jgi:Tol biopolymer transport system component
LPRDDYDDPVLSPDGRAFAVTVRGEMVVIDIETGRRSQVTRGGVSGFAVWASGGESLVYGAYQQDSKGALDVYRREAAGAEAAEMLAGESADEVPCSIHGETLLYVRFGGPGGFDLYTLDLDDPAATAAPLVSTAEDTANGQFSPDGRWVAYEVWEKGLPEVWVEPYPTGGRRRKISGESGGFAPIWSPAEREIFYVEDGRRMMSVRYATTADGAFEAEAPHLLFERAIDSAGFPRRLFDVTPDGQRFLVVDAPDTSRDELVVVENWFAELERLVPTK